MSPEAHLDCGTELVLYHFNDVYHINQTKTLARFSQDVRSPRHLTIFSGDAFAPSLESSVLKGAHIVPVLNHLAVDVACYDFDFGETRLRELSEKCSFPWVLSNVHSAGGGRLLASSKEYVVLLYGGYKLGFFGLAGSDWPSNCQHLPRDVIIADPVAVAHDMSRTLREIEGVDIVIAITHMRLAEDIKVSDACRQSVDLILGGHDHDIVVHGENVTVVNDDAEGNIRVIKSGTDFKSYGIVRLTVQRTLDGCRVQKVQVHHERDISLAQSRHEDEEMHHILSDVQGRITSMSSTRLFHTACPLDGRTARIRTAETNLGNMLADAVRAYYNTDIAFVNSGSIRCDRVIPVGDCTVRDVIDVLPFDNSFVVKRLSSKTLLSALENSVSDSRTDGRFLQLSGLSIRVDFRRPEGSRILRAAPECSRRLLTYDHDEVFTVAMVDFIAQGFDGYTCLTSAETIVDVEGAMTDTSLMLTILNPGNGEDRDEVDDNSAEMVSRARSAVVVDLHDGIPVVNPKDMQKRISIVSATL